MSQITSHVLDTAQGRPAQGIPLTLFRDQEVVGTDTTNEDGRSTALVDEGVTLEEGTYRLHFDLEAYHSSPFYPHADITFRVAAGGEHYHIPLLLSPFGYTTYRGS